MAKRFRLRISRFIPSFQPCGSDSKDSSIPIPSLFRFSPVIPTLLPKHHLPKPSKPHRSSPKRHVSCGFGCGNRSKPTLSEDDRSESSSPPSGQFRWEEEDKYWHVITTPNDVVVTPRRKIYSSSAEDENNDVVLPPPPPPPTAEKKKKKKKRRNKKKTTNSTNIRVSTSSAESGLYFSSDETETLVCSSRSFTTADELNSVEPRRKSKKKATKKKAKRRVFESESGAESNETMTTTTVAMTTPARLSVFQRLIPCRVEGKVRESFAVVKRSEDPYEDFKRSMMEMILEKQMFDDEDLEQLLHCFLSLNSKHHHGAIVHAFIEIWEALFCNSTRSSNSLSRRVSISRAV